MFKMKKLTYILGCTLILNGCAFSFKNDSHADLEIKPVMSIKHSSGSAKIMYLLGRYYQGKINYEKAISSYQKALAADPDYIQVHNSLGVIYAIQGQHELSVKHFNQAINLAPTKTYLHNNLGYAYLIQGNEMAAAESLKKALQLDPDNKQARINLATTFNRVGLHDEAAVLLLAINENRDQTVLNHVIDHSPESQSNNHIIKDEAVSQKDPKEENLVKVAPNVYEFKANKGNKGDPLLEALTKETSVVIEKEKNQFAVKGTRIEISNGNGKTGMAKKVSDFLNVNGFSNARLTNHNSFSHQDTVIFYQEGNKVQANQLNQVLPKHVEVIETDKLRNDIQVKLLLGRDFLQDVAYFDMNQKEQKLVKR